MYLLWITVFYWTDIRQTFHFFLKLPAASGHFFHAYKKPSKMLASDTHYDQNKLINVSDLFNKLRFLSIVPSLIESIT